MKTQEYLNKGELVSALVDGELREEEFAHAMDWLGVAEEARSTWHAYQVVGDVLRSGDAMTSTPATDFLARLRPGLKREAVPIPNALASDQLGAVEAATEAGLARKNSYPKAANAASFHWKMVAGVAASLLVALVVGWKGMVGVDDQGGAAQLVQLKRVPGLTESVLQGPVERDGQQVMLRDPQLDALLAAHKQFGGTSAFQVPTGFLRNATFEGAAR